MKTALITGGARGIGFGIARALAGEGWNLVLNGVRPEESVADSLETVRAQGVLACYAQGDIGAAAGRAAIVRKVREFAGGPLNLLVNNAGITSPGRMDILETTEDNLDLVLNTNLKGAFFLSQTFANEMIEAKKADPSFPACIVNVSSVSSTMVSVNRSEYCIAKAGLSMMNMLYAARLGEYGIPVFEVRPGVVKSDMTAGVTEKYDRLIADGLCPAKRWGYPEDVGKAVASLARGDFPFSTGQVVMVDGGLTIPRL